MSTTSAPSPLSARSLRICSFIPGATEIVAALGLSDCLVGISHECDFPSDINKSPVLVRSLIHHNNMTSEEIDRAVCQAVADERPLYVLDEVGFRSANPDLVIIQDLCDVCAVIPSHLHVAIQSLPKPPQVLSLHAETLEDVFSDIERIGRATDSTAQANTLIAELRRRLAGVQDKVKAERKVPTVACLEWLDPLYAAGHWVPEMVRLAGGENLLATAGTPSQRITWEQLIAAAPDIVVIMPCGFSIQRTSEEIPLLVSHPAWHHLPAVQDGRVFLVDAGSYFSRPGPRLVQGIEMLAAICHPSQFDDVMPAGIHCLSVPKAHAQPAKSESNR